MQFVSGKLKPRTRGRVFWGRPEATFARDSFYCQAAPRVPSRRMNPKPTSAAPTSASNIARATPAPKISFVSLGCPKALVDSERIIGRLRAEGYEFAKTHRDAA